MESQRSPEFFTENKLQADICTADNVRPEKFAFEQICCGLLQTYVDKNIKARRFKPRRA